MSDWGLGHADSAKKEFGEALSINPKHLDAMLKAAEIALKEGDVDRLNALKASIEPLDSDASEALSKKIASLKPPAAN